MNPADQQYFYGHTMPVETTSMLDMTIQLVERLGVSIAVVIMAFYYIMWLSKSNREERESFLKKDSENDDRLLKLVEQSSDALIHVKNALDQNTQAMRDLILINRGGNGRNH